MISESQIAEIRERTDIVALIGEYVPLKRVGASFKGVCPFHSEKTPSFYVHPARQFFHCFGCQASGDVITFLMRADGRTFPEAARTLAERAGIELPKDDPQRDAAERKKRHHEEQLLAALEAAAGFYIRMLKEHSFGHMAVVELERRGVDAETAAKFRLGYAPHGWDQLTQFLASKDFDPRVSEEAGLIVPRRSGGGHYDRFRHRLMFPISDPHGRIVAFSGRILPPVPGEEPKPEGEAGAKYVNSPEGPLYKKGELLFALHEARLSIRREGWAVLCEGNFDVVSMHRHGFTQSVAPLGTAFTLAQAKLIRRYAERVVLLFDGDKAGRKATRSAYPLLNEAGVTARVVRLPDGEDPDSFLRTRGAEALRDLVANAEGIIEYLIDESARESAGSAADRAQAISHLGPVLAKVENPVERQLYVERVAQRFGVRDLNIVKTQLRKGLSSQKMHKSAPAAPPDRPSGPPASLPPLECEVVGAFLDCPPLFDDPDAREVERLLTSGPLQSIFRSAQGMKNSAAAIDANALLAGVMEIAAKAWLQERLSIEKFDERAARGVLRDSLSKLRSQKIKQELPSLKKNILEAQRSGETEKARALIRQHDEMLARLRALQGPKK